MFWKFTLLLAFSTFAAIKAPPTHTHASSSGTGEEAQHPPAGKGIIAKIKEKLPGGINFSPPLARFAFNFAGPTDPVGRDIMAKYEKVLRECASIASIPEGAQNDELKKCCGRVRSVLSHWDNKLLFRDYDRIVGKDVEKQPTDKQFKKLAHDMLRTPFKAYEDLKKDCGDRV